MGRTREIGSSAASALALGPSVGVPGLMAAVAWGPRAGWTSISRPERVASEDKKNTVSGPVGGGSGSDMRDRSWSECCAVRIRKNKVDQAHVIKLKAD